MVSAAQILTSRWRFPPPRDDGKGGRHIVPHVTAHPPPIPLSRWLVCLLRGQGISPHVDTHSAFEDGLASLSLGSGGSCGVLWRRTCAGRTCRVALIYVVRVRHAEGCLWEAT